MIKYKKIVSLKEITYMGKIPKSLQNFRLPNLLSKCFFKNKISKK